MILRLCLIVTLLMSVGLCPVAARTSDQPIRVLVLSGKNNHDWRQTTPVVVRVLEESRKFSVRVLEDPSLCTSRSLSDVDVILSNWTNFPSGDRAWGEEAERAITGFVRSGKGFVVIHAASACFPDWPEYQQLIGATWGENTGHGAYGAFSVAVADTSHPIMRVLSGFTAEDELWHRMSRMPGAHVLCTGFSDTARGGTGAEEPVAYCMPFGQGRSFNLVLGHDARAVQDPNWRLLLLRGTEWAATGEASIEVPYDVHKALRVAVSAGTPVREQLREFDRLVQCSSRNPALRRELAHALSGMLDTGTPPAWKKIFCAWLSLIGGAAEVPALARLLDDPQLAFPARSALERIAGGAANDALRAAAAHATGLTLIGELNTLGEKRDTLAPGLLGAHLGGDRDPAVQAAAVHALGKITGRDAARLLDTAHVDSSLTLLRSESLLRCAEAFEIAGDTSAAGAIYDALNSSRQPPHIRAAALIGMIRCRGDRANAVLLAALTKGDEALAAALVQVLRQPAGRTLAALVAGRTSKLPSRRRVQVLYALADAGERGALTDMYAALGSRQPLLRRAALYGIAKLGDASSVARLCDAMKNADRAQRDEIGNCLARLQGQAVDERLCSVVGSHEPPATKEQVIAALAARGARSAVPALLAAATTGSGTLREAAIEALGSLADGSISRNVIDMLKNERSATNRSALVRCLVDLALRDQTPERVCDGILTSLAGSPAVARASMFQVLGRFGGAKEFQAVRPALADPDPDVQRSAIRVLSAWPGSAPLEDLFALAHSSGETAVRTLAMEGAVSLLEKCHDLQEEAKVRILERELGRAGSPEIETMLISTLGKLSTPGALQLAGSRLGRSEVATEAALAVVGIAGRMGEKDAEVAQRALTNALRSVPSSPVEARIRAALDDRQFQTGQRKIRVALVTGGHPFDEQAFLGMFSSDTGFTCTHVPQKDDSELFEETAGWPYDVVVLYNLTRTISEKRQQNFLRLLDAGVGLLSLHHASGAFSEWCEYPKIIGCRYLLGPVEHDGMRLEPSTYRHDVDIPVHVSDSGHAVTAGIHDFVVRDETYHGCQFEPDNHLLLTTDEQSSDVPLAWTRQYRQARVVHCQLGHGPGIFAEGQFRTLVAQAIRWCADGRREQIAREADLRRSQQ